MYIAGGINQVLVDSVCKFPEKAAHLGTFLFDIAPSILPEFSDEEVHILSALAKNIINGFQET